MANQQKEQIHICSTLFADTVEQSLELDYMLPEYYPAIFKVLKGSMQPILTAWRISGNKLVIEGVAFLKIVYVNEENGCMRLLEQKQPFVKTVELKEDGSGSKATLSARCSYFNCRAVNQRRLDLRGAISIKVSVTRMETLDVLGKDDQLQLRHQTLTCCDNTTTVMKELTISEQLSIGAGNPPIREVLRYEAIAVLHEVKLLSGKIVCKGELQLHMVYLTTLEKEPPQHLRQIVPLSHIVDIQGVEEQDIASLFAEVLHYDLDLQLEEDGDCHTYSINIGVRIVAMCATNRTMTVVDDGYSTRYETQIERKNVTFEEVLTAVCEETTLKETVTLRGELTAVYDLLPNIHAVSWELREQTLWICGNLQLSVLAADLEGLPVCLEQSIPFEFPLMETLADMTLRFSPMVQTLTTDFQILSANELEIRVCLLVNGLLYRLHTCTTVLDILEDEQCPKTREERVALRLYFADQGESIWSIAKRYNTSMQAIIGQNEVQGDLIESRSMLLIPQID